MQASEVVVMGCVTSSELIIATVPREDKATMLLAARALMSSNCELVACILHVCAPVALL